METKDEVEVISESIAASPHPAHYLMHKYWGRKPHNVVSHYIKNFTKEYDTILEPFMGSGVTVIEALKLNRKVIGLDINPMSYFIVKNTMSEVDLQDFQDIFKRIIASIENKYAKLYETVCPICNMKSFVETAVWEESSIKRIRGVCSWHGSFVKDAEESDAEIYKMCTDIKDELLENGQICFPTDIIMKYVKRSGREKINELFTDRALIILSAIRDEFLKVQDIAIRDLLMFCFTSMLSNVSDMLPGDLDKSTYKSGWVISKFWVPKIHTERNVFHCINLRFKAIVKGKKELQGISAELAQIGIRDSADLPFIESDSIDYIFTDPPYGESIAYLALSHFWNCWLENLTDYDNEIIIDPYRNKGYPDYENRIKLAFKEFYRVLKPECFMSFTFHNRDLNVWKAILDACNEAGFVLKNIVLQAQAVSSGTQGINRKNTLTGDFIYNFKKSIKDESMSSNLNIDSQSFIQDEIDNFISTNNGATPTELYEYLIPRIVQHRAYIDTNGNVIDIEQILKKNYEYEKQSDFKNKVGGAYKWVKK